MKLIQIPITTDITTLTSESISHQINIKDMLSEQQWEELINRLMTWWDDNLQSFIAILGFIAKVNLARVPAGFSEGEKKQRLLNYLASMENPANFLGCANALFTLYPTEVIDCVTGRYQALVTYINKLVRFSDKTKITPIELAVYLKRLFPGLVCDVCEPNDDFKGRVVSYLTGYIDTGTYDEYLEVLAMVKVLWPQYFNELDERIHFPTALAQEFTGIQDGGDVFHYIRMMSVVQNLIGEQVNIDANGVVYYPPDSANFAVPDQLIIN